MKKLSRYSSTKKITNWSNLLTQRVDIIIHMFSHTQVFDMKKFQSNVNRELRRAYPDRRRLETQCLSAVAFVKSENDILDCPIWVLIINVVAMDMLKSKLPPGKQKKIILNFIYILLYMFGEFFLSIFHLTLVLWSFAFFFFCCCVNN